MAAFGVSFPKLTLCRSSTSKADTNTVSTAIPTTTATRTLSLSIKNVPSQSLHYDVSTTTVQKKKTTTTSSIATILAIDGETKQLPKNLSVFNELQFDCEAGDINEKKRREENSNDVILPSSLSPMRAIDHRLNTRFLANISKKILYDEKKPIEERRSNHTFTPPTSSVSNESSSSSDDLRLTLSSISVDLPQLNYAIEKFLVEDQDDPVYQIVEDFSSVCSLFHQDRNENAHSPNVTTSDLTHSQNDNTEHHSIPEKNINNEEQSHPSPMSSSIKWYVSELRINRPLIYRTQWTNGQQRSSYRKLSHSFNDLKQVYLSRNLQEDCRYEKPNEITYSTLSLQNLNDQQRRHQSNENILLSCTDDDFNNLHSDEDDQHQSPLILPKTLRRLINKGDTLIRNESVKQKLFDILNDDELENACLEDMSQEFEKMSLIHDRLLVVNSFSSSSDDALYSSPPNELHVSLQPPPPLSTSYNENLSANINNTTERFYGRSRLITTSLDKIPMNNNASLLRPSYESTRPTWYTSPLPQWRTDDQLLPISSVLKRHSSKKDLHRNDDESIDSNRLLRTKTTEYGVKENMFIHHHHHHRKEQKHVNYSLLNISTPLIDDSTTILPIIQDKSSNLLMFI